MIGLALLACTAPAPAPPDAAFAGPRLVYVGEPASFTTTPGDLAFEWDLGDGSSATGPEIEHAWAAPGHYPLRLWVTDEAGAVATSTQRITVVHRPLSAPPQHSGSLALDGARLWVALPDHGVIAEVSTETGQVVHHPVCARPVWVAAEAGRVWASCPEEDALWAYDGAWRRIGLVGGDRPAGVVAVPAAAAPEGAAWVALAGRGQVARVGLDGVHTYANSVPDLRGLARSDGRLFTAAWRPTGGQTAIGSLADDFGDPRLGALAPSPAPTPTPTRAGSPPGWRARRSRQTDAPFIIRA